MDRFRIGADCGRSSLVDLGIMEETPLEVFTDEVALVAEPVDSHSNESVPLSPRLLLI
jgi:hypothetical protein